MTRSCQAVLCCQSSYRVVTFPNRLHHHPLGTGFQAFGLLPDAADQGTLALSIPLPIQPETFDDLSVGPGLDVISPRARPEDANGPSEFEIPRALIPLTQPPGYTSETPPAVKSMSTSVCGECSSVSNGASDLVSLTTDYELTGGTRTVLSATATQRPVPTTTTGTCCSERHSKLHDNNTDENEHAVGLSREDPRLLPVDLFQPAMASYYRYNTERESTVPCAEAYLLIAQQNFRGVSQEDVATWLWHRFRKTIRRNEGCRVKTDLLFSLLTFISDV